MILYGCEVCKKYFNRKSNYLTHIKTHENSTVQTSVATNTSTCKHRNKTFTNSGRLKYHIEHNCKHAPNQMVLDIKQTMQIQMAKFIALFE